MDCLGDSDGLIQYKKCFQHLLIDKLDWFEEHKDEIEDFFESLVDLMDKKIEEIKHKISGGQSIICYFHSCVSYVQTKPKTMQASNSVHTLEQGTSNFYLHLRKESLPPRTTGAQNVMLRFIIPGT